MRKILLPLVFALSSSFLCSCDFLSNDSNTNTETSDSKTEIIIDGNLTKTTYQFTDSAWNLNGLVIKTKDSDGVYKTLKTGEYTINCNPGVPRGYKGEGLTVQVKVNGIKNGKSKKFSNVTVSQETYNFQDEITNYYSDLNLTSASNKMFALQKHSFSKHQNWVSYGQVVSYYKVTDEHRSVDEIPGVYKNENFYTGKESPFGSGTKEHVWACADSGPNTSNRLWSHNGSGSNNVDDDSYVGGGSDLYHVRPCQNAVNTARGDAYFTEFSSSSGVKTQTESGGTYGLKVKGATGPNAQGNYEYADEVEVDDNFKGDLARIIAYVYMHYNYSGYISSLATKYTGTLKLSYVLKASSGYNSVNDMLKAWNEIDPVSDVEKYRNHTVEQIQGNRNPFVDHPEWIDTLF